MGNISTKCQLCSQIINDSVYISCALCATNMHVDCYEQARGQNGCPNCKNIGRIHFVKNKKKVRHSRLNEG